MSADPLVSVIIPTYNRAKLIPAAVASVVSQSYKNFEIVVVDDGSTDDTKKVIRNLQTGNDIKYIYSENGGPAHARNIGMRSAQGKYIAFLDSDDLYYPYKLALQVSFMESHPEAGLVYTEVTGFDDADYFEEYHLRAYHRLYNKKGWSYDDLFDIRGELNCEAVKKTVPYYIGNLFDYVLQGPLVMTNTVLFPKEILTEVGYQNEKYRLGEEYEHITRICKKYKVGFLNIPTYSLRYHKEQISKVKVPRSKAKVMAEIGMEKVFLQTVLDLGCDDKDYYRQNHEWLNPRVASLYHCLGEKMLEIGHAGEARQYFLKGHSIAPTWRKNIVSWIMSFLPSIIRRLAVGISGRIPV